MSGHVDSSSQLHLLLLALLLALLVALIGGSRSRSGSALARRSRPGLQPKRLPWRFAGLFLLGSWSTESLHMLFSRPCAPPWSCLSSQEVEVSWQCASALASLDLHHLPPPALPSSSAYGQSCRKEVLS